MSANHHPPTAHAGTEQRKLAAIMFTDLVDYSALSQRNEARRSAT
jgi:class 3 adenylate cyclase